MQQRLGVWWWHDSRQPLRNGIAFGVSISVIVIFVAMAFLYGRPNAVEALLGLSPLFVVLSWTAMFSGSMSISRHRKDDRPWLTVGGGRPAWVVFVVGTLWTAAVATIYLLRDEVGLALFNGGTALAYSCVSFPARLSLRRAALSGVGLLVTAIGAVLVRLG